MRVITWAGFFLSWLIVQPIVAQPSAGLFDGVNLFDGEWHLVPRLRYESVDDTAFVRTAEAITLRSRLNYKLPAWRGWTTFVELDDVRALDDDYNSTRNGTTSRPVIPDPEGTELNQATLSFAHEHLQFVAGRQRIALDDQRFIGPSSWRQNETTLDAITTRLRGARAELWYGFIDNVNRAVGPKRGAPPGDWRSNSHLVNARLAAGAFGSVVGFFYRLDFDNAPAASSNTYGLRWTGATPFSERFEFTYALSVAEQEDAGDNPSNFDADYRLAQIGLRRGNATIAVGEERLSGHVTRTDSAFQTPLGTVHIFQGWADKFATTPPRGVRDRYALVNAAWRDATIQAQLAWHRFIADAGHADKHYGDEWNASLSVRIRTRYEVLVKAADYAARGFAADTTKLWLQATANF